MSTFTQIYYHIVFSNRRLLKEAGIEFDEKYLE